MILQTYVYVNTQVSTPISSLTHQLIFFFISTVEFKVSGESYKIIAGREGGHVSPSSVAREALAKVPRLRPRQAKVRLHVEAFGPHHGERRVASLACDRIARAFSFLFKEQQ